MTKTTEAAPIPASLVLQPETFDLWGSRLIEASAGTGKTWTIAALYLRLVLGHGADHGFERALRPAEILVMTFTRAATRELSDRIRERLLGAAQCFRGEKEVDKDDAFLASLMSAYESGTERNRAAWALAMAAESMDDASVHTIDAWCQRMLREHAFDSGNLFDEELVADEEVMRTEACQDYWRQACYPLEADRLSRVLDIWGSVDALIADMRDLQNQDIPEQAGFESLAQVLDRAVSERAQVIDAFKAVWGKRAQTMQAWLDAQTADKNSGWNGQKLSPKNYSKWLATLLDWADDPIDDEKPDLKTGWERFTPDGLMQARKPGAAPIELPVEFAQFAEFKAAFDELADLSVAVRLHAACRVARRLVELKRKTSSFGFADMLQRLDAALRGANGQRLRERILAQYPVALIDEFQDTSPLQYRIFDQIYRTQTNDRHNALLLIGDPKQSIYGFRGADIYSYMQARRATSGRHYVLETNFRSTQALVGVVNHWFAQADSQCSEGAFMFRKEQDDPLPFVQVRANGRKERLQGDTGTVAALTLVHDLEVRSADDTRKFFAQRCAERIVSWLNDPQAGFLEEHKAGEAAKPIRPLRPADIAVLVRTGREAAAVRRELGRRSVASVYLSDKDSVFDSDEAKDLVHWLHAVATPQDVRLVRAGLATRTVGLSLDELGWLASDDEAFDARVEQLRQLRTVWQLQGVLAMLRQTLHVFGLASRWLSTEGSQSGGERHLTNFLHMAELLQTASSALDGEQALIRWLITQMQDGGAQGDEQVVRLESDADLVKVITIHKSKGLEYPIVCLPYATSFRAKDRRYTSFVNLADEEGNRELRLQFGAEELAMADRDRLREDLRLLYVALTRARHALWVGFAAVKSGNSDACVSHKSGAGYTLGGPDPVEASAWLAHLRRFAQGRADIVLQEAQDQTPVTALTTRLQEGTLKFAPTYSADFERDWSIGSFSRLARDLTPMATFSPGRAPDWSTAPMPGATDLSPIQMPRPADDEFSPADGAEQGQAKAAAKAANSANGSAAWHRFSKGAEAGNFLHDQLQWLAGDGFCLNGNERLAARLSQRCERAGRGAHAQDVATWLGEVVQTQLSGPDAALADLEHVLAEAEFWLPVQRIDARDIDAVCRQYLLPGVARPALAERQLHGMLMGFADLVFEHQGRYWVLDYKSNFLGESDASYDSAALANSMAEHRYDVQAAIYMLALHRLLKLRLGESYQPEEHLGGAVYLFLRGIKGPEKGVCLLTKCTPLMDALDAMLGEEGVSA
ncbi:MAG: exodeoxyribonuclease V subunit beta [Rhodoferax sp.]